MAAPAAATELTSRLGTITAVLTTCNILCAAAMCGRVAIDTVQNRRRIKQEEEEAQANNRDLEKGGGGGGGGAGGAGSSGQRSRRGRRGFYYWWWDFIPPTEVFSLVYGLVIMVQGVMLAAVESQGTAVGEVISGNRCQTLAVVTWIALWVPCYTIFVFSAEAAQRAVKASEFQPRSSLRTLCSCMVAALLLLLTWVLARSSLGKATTCPTMLMQHVLDFAPGAVGLLVALCPLTLFLQFVVWKGLSWRYEEEDREEDDIDREQRIATSREILFCTCAALQWPILIPHFAAASTGTLSSSSSDVLSFVAAVGVNISGMCAFALFCYLHGFAASSTSATHAQTGAPTQAIGVDIGAPVEVVTEKQQMYVMEAFVSDSAHQQERGQTSKHTHTPADVNKPLPTEPGAVSVVSGGPFHGAPRSVWRSSRGTLVSFHRLGDEINSLIASLVDSPRSSLARSRFSLQSRSTHTGSVSRFHSFYNTTSSPIRLPDEKTYEFDEFDKRLPAGFAVPYSPSPSSPGFFPRSPSTPGFPLPSSPAISDFPMPSRRTPVTPSSVVSVLSLPSIRFSQPASPTAISSTTTTTSVAPRRPDRAAVPSINTGRTPVPAAVLGQRDSFGNVCSLSPPARDLAARSSRFPSTMSRNSTWSALQRLADDAPPDSPIGVARSTACTSIEIPRAPPMPIEIAPPPPGRFQVARRSEDAESFKEIARWR